MPVKAIRSARSRRHDDKSAESLQKASLKTKGIQARVKDVPLSEALWNCSQAIRENVLKTYFINGLNDGTLDPVKFGQYVVQDAVYCYKCKVDLDVVASRASGHIQDFFLEEGGSYETYYKEMFKEWSINDPKGIHLNSACQGYVDYQARVAGYRDPIYFIVACLPCARLWPWIGEQFNHSGKASGLYQDWVNENFTGSGYVKWEEFVNGSQDIDVNVAQEIYIECMKGELSFFDSIKQQ